MGVTGVAVEGGVEVGISTGGKAVTWGFPFTTSILLILSFQLKFLRSVASDAKSCSPPEKSLSA